MIRQGRIREASYSSVAIQNRQVAVVPDTCIHLKLVLCCVMTSQFDNVEDKRDLDTAVT